MSEVDDVIVLAAYLRLVDADLLDHPFFTVLHFFWKQEVDPKSVPDRQDYFKTGLAVFPRELSLFLGPSLLTLSDLLLLFSGYLSCLLKSDSDRNGLEWTEKRSDTCRLLCNSTTTLIGECPT